jgi:hypothetical protein
VGESPIFRGTVENRIIENGTVENRIIENGAVLRPKTEAGHG